MVKLGQFALGAIYPLTLTPLTVGQPNRLYDVVLTFAAPLSPDQEQAVVTSLYQASFGDSIITAAEATGNQVHLQTASSTLFVWAQWLDLVSTFLIGIAPIAIIAILVGLFAAQIPSWAYALLIAGTLGLVLWSKGWFRR